MARALATVLLIEHEPALRNINAQILSEAGYQVERVPHHHDAIKMAVRIKPNVIVIGIRPWVLTDRHIVEDLQRNPRTHAIPVVVIGTFQEVVSAVATVPNVRQTVVAPYDIETLETAVALALSKGLAKDSPSEHQMLLRVPG